MIIHTLVVHAYWDAITFMFLPNTCNYEKKLTLYTTDCCVHVLLLDARGPGHFSKPR